MNLLIAFIILLSSFESKISGVVTNSERNSKPVIRAEVYLFDSQDKLLQVTLTDTSGYFSFNPVPHGFYSFYLVFLDFRGTVMNNINLSEDIMFDLEISFHNEYKKDIKHYVEYKRNVSDKTTSRLDMSSQGLKNIPPEVFKLKNLKEMYLENNKIDHIPEEFEDLKQLRYLDIRNNNLSKEDIVRLKGLLPFCIIIFG